MSKISGLDRDRIEGLGLYDPTEDQEMVRFMSASALPCCSSSGHSRSHIEDWISVPRLPSPSSTQEEYLSCSSALARPHLLYIYMPFLRHLSP